jgi:molecular chaperone IbpA
LSIESVKNDKTKERDENGNVIHQGIAKRYFKKSFSIADNCEVKNAELKDGLLRVSLERIIPEAQKPRVIDIK